MPQLMWYTLISKAENGGNNVAKKKKRLKQPEKKKNTNLIIIIAVVVVAAFVVVGLQFRSTSEKTFVSAVDDQSLRKGETRQTLSPSQISDPFIAAVYQTARDIPHVFDSVKCYCYCEGDPFNHVSLLSCFVDKHAAG